MYMCISKEYDNSFLMLFADDPSHDYCARCNQRRRGTLIVQTAKTRSIEQTQCHIDVAKKYLTVMQ